MTEPVARAVSPRRTVRVAVALVAGQAALCAVIGWVTFGPSEPEPRAAGAHPPTVPIELPTSRLKVPALPPAPAPPAVSAFTASSTASPRASRSSKPPPSRATSKPAAETPQPVMAVDETPAAPPAPSPDLAATQPPEPIEATQFPRVEGEPCSPDGATGLTSDRVELKCAKDADGDLVWQIN